jgi:hypothetical protein
MAKLRIVQVPFRHVENMGWTPEDAARNPKQARQLARAHMNPEQQVLIVKDFEPSALPYLIYVKKYRNVYTGDLTKPKVTTLRTSFGKTKGQYIGLTKKGHATKITEGKYKGMTYYKR